MLWPYLHPPLPGIEYLADVSNNFHLIVQDNSLPRPLSHRCAASSAPNRDMCCMWDAKKFKGWFDGVRNAAAQGLSDIEAERFCRVDGFSAQRCLQSKPHKARVLSAVHKGHCTLNFKAVFIDRLTVNPKSIFETKL